jgi:predicted enzyme related to lactoylglutathione lyase
MTTGVTTLLIPVRDVDTAKAIYGALLGVDPIADGPYYVGYNIDGQDIGLVPNGHAQGMTGPVAYVDVEGIAATLETLKTAGATVTQEPTDVGGGLLVATFTDAEGNALGVRQPPK